MELWPHVVVVEDSDFLHNDALLVQHEIFRWATIVRACSYYGHFLYRMYM